MQAGQQADRYSDFRLGLGEIEREERDRDTERLRKETETERQTFRETELTIKIPSKLPGRSTSLVSISFYVIILSGFFYKIVLLCFILLNLPYYLITY